MINALISPPSKKTFAIVDIGTTKVLCLVVRLTSDNKIAVLGTGHTQSNGIRCGAIMNVKEANECIIEAVQEAEKAAQESVDQVYVNVAGCGIKSKIVNVRQNFGNRQIQSKDISKIINQATREVTPPDIAVHAVPLNYSLDQVEGINNPLHMHGSELAAEVNVITVLKSALLNLEHCLTQCPLNLKGCSVSSYSSSLASLTTDEQSIGSMAIDIGGGSTAIGLFRSGNIIYADCIPIGGMHITYDIACAFNLKLSTAERVKNLYGSALITSSEVSGFVEVDDREIDESARKIPLTTLSHIIRPRIEEIFDFIKQKVSNFTISKVVLSGGTSQLPNIKELAQCILGHEVRIGTYRIPDGLSQEQVDGSFAAVIGLSELIAKQGMAKTIEKSRTPSSLRKFLSMLAKR